MRKLLLIAVVIVGLLPLTLGAAVATENSASATARSEERRVGKECRL